MARIIIGEYPVGSLLKQEIPIARKKDRSRGRETDTAYLGKIRLCACLRCGIDPAGEAAHVRMAGYGKPITGMGRRPDDRYTMPLCHDCHMEQHRMGEQAFWRELGINPVTLSKRLYRCRENLDLMRTTAFDIQQDIAASE